MTPCYDEPAARGGCLCGTVRYRIVVEPLHVDHCHCGLCRRGSGAPVVTWMTVPREALIWDHGGPMLYRSSARAERGFCAACGSKLTFAHDDFPDEIDVSLGSLDDPGRVAPSEQIHGESRVDWVRIDPGVPWRDGHAPHDSGWPAPLPSGDRTTREGGCLCGAVRYAVTGPPVKSAICHCSICRRETGALFAAWGIWPADRFTAHGGETQAYQSSETGRRRFCPVCGATVFFDSVRAPDQVEIMLAGLDDPDAVPPARHQFAVDAPGWLVCDDTLPRHRAAPADGDPDDDLLR